MRVSDAQRERTVALLGERCREGYLSVDTLAGRLDRAWTAKSDDELRALIRDVPPRHRRLARLRELFGRPARELPIRWLTPPAELGDGPLLVGRDPDCDFLVEDPAVSGRHLELRRDDDGWTLTDLGSRNGTRVNGWRVRSIRVHRGDRIEVGGATFVFVPPAAQ